MKLASVDFPTLLQKVSPPRLSRTDSALQAPNVSIGLISRNAPRPEKRTTVTDSSKLENMSGETHFSNRPA